MSVRSRRGIYGECPRLLRHVRVSLHALVRAIFSRVRVELEQKLWHLVVGVTMSGLRCSFGSSCSGLVYQLRTLAEEYFMVSKCHNAWTSSP